MIDPFDDIDLDLDPPEPTDEELREDEEVAESDEWVCCFPDQCCMPGLHRASECHIAEDLIAMEQWFFADLAATNQKPRQT